MRKLAIAAAAFALTATAAAAAGPTSYVVAHGQTRFGDFTISGHLGGADLGNGLVPELCLQLDMRGSGGASCPFSIARHHATSQPDQIGDCANHVGAWLGIATDRVASVRLTYADGRALRARLYPLPPALKPRTRVYLALAGTTRSPRSVSAFDSMGHRIDHRQVRAEPGSGCHEHSDHLVGSTLITAGQAPDGGDYQFRAGRTRDDRGHARNCAGIRERKLPDPRFEAAGEACGLTLHQGPLRLENAGNCAPPGETFYFGLVAPDVSRLTITLDAGESVNAQLYPAPASLRTSASFLFAAARRGRIVRAVAGYDSTGRQLFSYKEFPSTYHGRVCTGSGQAFYGDVPLAGPTPRSP